MQVDQEGSIASYDPGKLAKGMGGAMDIVVGAKRVVVTMEHVARNGDRRCFAECTLPLTGRRCVDRIITDLCVFDVLPDGGAGLRLIELAPGVTVEEIERRPVRHSRWVW